MAERLCPKCGAYWQCECILESWAQPVDPLCEHDWIEAVGVERDDILPEDAQVVMCRLCGLYAVSRAEEFGRR